MNVPQIFAAMPTCYLPNRIQDPCTYYFSVGDHKYTVRLSPEGCVVEPGKTSEQADVVLKTTPELFEKMVVHGDVPSAFDVMRGRVKTNNPAALKRLRGLFDFSKAG